jgi:hypothetical protein
MTSILINNWIGQLSQGREMREKLQNDLKQPKKFLQNAVKAGFN